MVRAMFAVHHSRIGIGDDGDETARTISRAWVVISVCVSRPISAGQPGGGGAEAGHVDRREARCFDKPLGQAVRWRRRLDQGSRGQKVTQGLGLVSIPSQSPVIRSSQGQPARFGPRQRKGRPRKPAGSG